MSRKVLIAIASEMDGHAAADAIRATVSNYDSEVSISNLLKKKLVENPTDKVEITNIHRDGDVWRAYGWAYFEDYPFAAIIAPNNYVHIGTSTE